MGCGGPPGGDAPLWPAMPPQRLGNLSPSPAQDCALFPVFLSRRHCLWAAGTRQRLPHTSAHISDLHVPPGTSAGRARALAAPFPQRSLSPPHPGGAFSPPRCGRPQVSSAPPHVRPPGGPVPLPPGSRHSAGVEVGGASPAPLQTRCMLRTGWCQALRAPGACREAQGSLHLAASRSPVNSDPARKLELV